MLRELRVLALCWAAWSYANHLSLDQRLRCGRSPFTQPALGLGETPAPNPFFLQQFCLELRSRMRMEFRWGFYSLTAHDSLFICKGKKNDLFSKDWRWIFLPDGWLIFLCKKKSLWLSICLFRLAVIYLTKGIKASRPVGTRPLSLVFLTPLGILETSWLGGLSCAVLLVESLTANIIVHRGSKLYAPGWPLFPFPAIMGFSTHRTGSVDMRAVCFQVSFLLARGGCWRLYAFKY